MDYEQAITSELTRIFKAINSTDEWKQFTVAVQGQDLPYLDLTFFEPDEPSARLKEMFFKMDDLCKEFLVTPDDKPTKLFHEVRDYGIKTSVEENALYNGGNPTLTDDTGSWKFSML